MANKSELILFAKTSVQPSFYDVFQCFSGFNHRLPLFPMFFLDAAIGTTFLQLFSMVAIVVTNGHRQRSFPQVYRAEMI